MSLPYKNNMSEFLPVLIFVGVASILSSVIVGASYLLAVKNPDSEKVSVYECGFDPFGDSRQKFEVRFFLVAILFIIFDLEISFLFPWSIVLSDIDVFGYWTMWTFLVILTVGLVYEWLKGGLEWE
jgi:NADH-quinone oxidoreductase subunit A